MKNEEYNDIFNDGNKPVDYKTIIFEYLLYWPVIAVCLVLSIAAAYTHLRYKTPVYKVASTVLIKQGDILHGQQFRQRGRDYTVLHTY